MTRIAVFGAGRVGGYFGARLARAIEPGSFSSLHDDLVAGRRPSGIRTGRRARNGRRQR
jgi:hypothetical protein